uniref:COG0477: Permeases of the major facilitator superfamily n=1 Tax=uncultured bacterium Contig1777_n_1791_cl TaxID=1393515 RepID=W0FMX3_9BACT|nr:COG0477: Permeases of the major facilitator superfamily [uncultured bacterium Contig1777_n_1791_cl]
MYDGNKTNQTAVFYLGEEPEAPAPAAEPAATGEEKNIGRDLQDFLTNYEDFADEYIEFLTKYLKADPGEMLSLLGDYAEYAEKYADFAAQIKDFDTSKLTSEELAYFREVTDRVTRKLAELLDR